MVGLVPATSIVLALCLDISGRRDKLGDDAGDSTGSKSAVGFKAVGVLHSDCGYRRCKSCKPADKTRL